MKSVACPGFGTYVVSLHQSLYLVSLIFSLKKVKVPRPNFQYQAEISRAHLGLTVRPGLHLSIFFLFWVAQAAPPNHLTLSWVHSSLVPF